MDRKGKGKVGEPPKKPQGNNSEDDKMWVEKYRPQELSDLISHTDIISTLQRLIKGNKLPHTLLYGPPGTGKTSTILACAKLIYGPNYKQMILELNASDERGIDVVREKIKTFASSRQMFSTEKQYPFKLIVLDECDAMTTIAQNALRRSKWFFYFVNMLKKSSLVVEKYTKNVRFCLICNYVGKIIPAIQSRTTRFRFAPLNPDQVSNRLNQIAQLEGLHVDSDAIEALVTLSKGDMRRSLNILQSCASTVSTITVDTIYKTTGAPSPSDISVIFDTLLTRDFEVAYTNILATCTSNGYALSDIIQEVFKKLSTVEVGTKRRLYLVREMSEIESRLASACSDKTQLGALVGTFKLGMDIES